MSSPDIYLSFPELRAHGVPYCRVHLNRLIDRGDFPPSRRLSPNRVAWRLADIEHWKATRPVARGAEAVANPKEQSAAA